MSDPTNTPPEPASAPHDRPSYTGIISILTMLFSIYWSGHQDNKTAHAIHDSWSTVLDALPYVLGFLASLYTWASHGPMRLKKLFGIRPKPATAGSALAQPALPNPETQP